MPELSVERQNDFPLTMNTRDAVTQFLAAKNLSERSRADYGRYLYRLADYAGTAPLKEVLSLARVTDWVSQLKQSGAYAARNGVAYLKSFASWCHIVYGTPRLEGFEYPKVPVSTRTALTDDEVKQVFGTFSLPTRNGSRTRAYIALLLSSGLRRDEARQLLLSDLVESPPHVRVRAETTKGRRGRVSRLSGAAIALIRDYIVQRPPYKGEPPEPLFLAEYGTAFTPKGFGSCADEAFNVIERLTGLRISSHIFRHTWATNYARGMGKTGNTVYDLKREGGWKNLVIPLTYIHDRPEAELLAMPVPGAINGSW